MLNAVLHVLNAVLHVLNVFRHALNDIQQMPDGIRHVMNAVRRVMSGVQHLPDDIRHVPKRLRQTIAGFCKSSERQKSRREINRCQAARLNAINLKDFPPDENVQLHNLLLIKRSFQIK